MYISLEAWNAKYGAQFAAGKAFHLHVAACPTCHNVRGSWYLCKEGKGLYDAADGLFNPVPAAPVTWPRK